MEITLEIPEPLAHQLQPYQDRLPEVLARGLQEVQAEAAGRYQDEARIMDILSSRPEPEQILAIQPSPEFQARTSELLYRAKHNELSMREENELTRYLTLEHLVRLAKARAYQQLAQA